MIVRQATMSTRRAVRVKPPSRTCAAPASPAGHHATPSRRPIAFACPRRPSSLQYGPGTASLNVAVAASIVLHHFALWAGYEERAREVGGRSSAGAEGQGWPGRARLLPGQGPPPPGSLPVLRCGLFIVPASCCFPNPLMPVHPPRPRAGSEVCVGGPTAAHRGSWRGAPHGRGAGGGARAAAAVGGRRRRRRGGAACADLRGDRRVWTDAWPLTE